VLRHRPPLAAALSGVTVAAVAFAHESPPRAETESGADLGTGEEARASGAEEVLVHGEARGVDAASRVHVGRRELELRPRLRPGDLLEAAPGLFAVQHAGGGKANQYFLRGFDADHGTDVAFFVDGMPVNMPSHGHGQGFADVHFVIPELVVGVDAAKGPYYADLGNFATAGAVKLHLADTYGEHVAQVSAGSFGVRRGLVIASPSLGDDWKVLLAGESAAQDGPFQLGENLGRTNLFAKVTHEPSGRSRLAVTAMAYGSTWRASGQLPVRAVCGEGEPSAPAPASFGQPCVDRFGFVDPSEGGSTTRASLSALYTHAKDDTSLRALAYAIRYDFRLHSNFTFFAEDPANGDGLEQTDARTVLGTNVEATRHWHPFGAPLVVRAGVDVRRDGTEVELWHQDQARTRLEAQKRSGVEELASAGYVEADARLSDEVRVVAGLRAQRLDVAVTDRLTETGPSSGSGTRGASLALPKLSVIVTPRRDLQLFVNGGRGFHSNDARGAVLRSAPRGSSRPHGGRRSACAASPRAASISPRSLSASTSTRSSCGPATRARRRHRRLRAAWVSSSACATRSRTCSSRTPTRPSRARASRACPKRRPQCPSPPAALFRRASACDRPSVPSRRSGRCA
jgi:outer membrane receptor protein involved in Fe transport